MRHTTRTLAVLAATALVIGATALPARAEQSEYGYFTVSGRTYIDFAQAAVWARTGTGVTYTGIVSGPTGNQFAASRARVFDEFGLWCEGDNTFSTYPEGATGYACALPPGFSFYSQGISFGHNDRLRNWTASYTRTTRYEVTSRLSAPTGDPGLDASADDAGPIDAPADDPTAWPVNAFGESYGNALYATSPQDEPDLLTATSTEGARGYVRRTELEAADGTAPLRQGAVPGALPSRDAADRTVAVYQLDGRTEIGRFLIAGSATQHRLARALADAG